MVTLREFTHVQETKDRALNTEKLKFYCVSVLYLTVILLHFTDT